MSDTLRRIELVPPNGWRILYSELWGERAFGLCLNLRSWTVGVDFWPGGGGVSLGPIALACVTTRQDDDEAAA